MALRLSKIGLFTFSKSLQVTSKQTVKRWVAPTLRIMKRRRDQMGPLTPNHRNTYVEWNYNAEVYAFGKRLGEDFEEDLLRRALTERSYIVQEELKQEKVGINQPKVALQDNVEFINAGETLINKYILRYLRTVYPKFPEEGICAVRDYLMSEEVLADISSHIGTSEIILCQDFPVEKSTLSNVLRAVIYALSLSSGEHKANIFIRDFIITYLSGKDINEIGLSKISDPLQILSKILERDNKPQFEPRLIGAAGRNTILANYQVGLYSDKNLIGVGFGESIEIAKEIAAFDALKRLFKTTIKAKPMPFDLELSVDSNPPFANLSIQDWCEKNVTKLITQVK